MSGGAGATRGWCGAVAGRGGRSRRGSWRWLLWLGLTVGLSTDAVAAPATAPTAPAAARGELEGAAAAARLRALLGNRPTIEGRFSQVVADARGNPVQRSSGRFLAQQPRQLRWQVQAPAAQLLVTDGKQVWLYDPDLEQVTIDTLDAGTAEAPMLVLSGQVDGLLDRYALTARQQRDDWTFELRAKNQRAGVATSFRAVRLTVRGGVVRAMQVEDSLGQRTSLDFAEVRHPARVDAAQFRFTVPPGTEVVRR